MMEPLTRSLVLGLAATALALPAIGQGGDAFTLRAERVQITEGTTALTIQLTGGVHLTHGDRTLQAPAITVTLTPPGGGRPLTQLQPITAEASGGVRVNDAGSSGSAGRARYSFTTEVLNLSGSVSYSQSAPQRIEVKAATVEARQEPQTVNASGGVTFTLHNIAALGASSGPLTVAAPSATWTGSDGRLVAPGGGAGSVSAKQGGVSLTASSLTLVRAGEAVSRMDVAGPVNVAGDLEGNGQQMAIRADSASYDPAKDLLTLTGNVTVTRGQSTSTAKSALLTIGTQHRLTLQGAKAQIELPRDPAPATDAPAPAESAEG